VIVLLAVVVAMKKAVATPVAVEEVAAATPVEAAAEVAEVAVSTVLQPVLPSAPLLPSSARPSVPLQPSRMTISAKARSRTAWKTMTFRFDGHGQVMTKNCSWIPFGDIP
jgi:hypothetical protein